MVLLFSMEDTIKKNSLITPWTKVHFLTGYLFSLYGINILNISFNNAFWIGLLLHTLYEIKDLSCYFLNCSEENTWHNNSFINSISDTIFYIIGFCLIKIINIKSVSYIVGLTFVYLIIVVLFILYSLEF